MTKIIIIILLALLLTICLFALDVMGCCGEPDPLEGITIKDVIEPTDDYIFGRVVPICIRGHEYYYARYSVSAFAVSHLDDDGKPVKCGPERNSE